VLVDDMQANTVGVMEVMLGTGTEAVDVLTEAINTRKKSSTGNANWKCQVTNRNVSIGKSTARRADKYALIWDAANVHVDTSSVAVATSKTVDFPDRWPMTWQMSAIGGKGKVLNCLLWHAPQPKYHLKSKTIQLIANLAEEISISTSNSNFLISGDFNYNTGDNVCYAPLTNKGFLGVFDGSRTTLTTLKSFIKDEENRKKMIQQGNIDEAFLASAYDNIFIYGVKSNFEVKVCIPYVILQEIRTSVHFQIVTRMQLQKALQNAKIISDHMPIVLTVEE
jgi:hypothetical protein